MDDGDNKPKLILNSLRKVNNSILETVNKIASYGILDKRVGRWSCIKYS